jgi:methylated-DNA-protein-cysteine methyltransferase-like protein
MKPLRSPSSTPSPFVKAVLRIVRAIPRGKVLTYGQVAILAGVPRGARAVGGVLFGLGSEGRVPWQRVINGEGGISTYRVGSGHRQKKLLKEEGVRFSRDGRVNLKTHQWFPPFHLTQKWELPEAYLVEFHRKLRL